jgi:hypothetical protein
MKNDILLTGNGLLLVGLLLATVAGILLAYDGIHGAGARFQAEVLITGLRSFRAFRADLQDSIRNLPSPPWTEEEKKDQLTQEEKTWGPQEKDLADRAGTIDDKYKSRVEVFALRGIYMLVGAFVLQLAGTVLVGLETVHL